MDVKKDFPKLYAQVLAQVSGETARILQGHFSLLAMHGDVYKQKVLEYTHNYEHVVRDVFIRLRVPQYLDRFEDEVQAYFAGNDPLDLGSLCGCLEDSLRRDLDIQKRILAAMIHFNCQVGHEKPEECAIRNAPDLGGL